jgi:hypothetical protein
MQSRRLVFRDITVYLKEGESLIEDGIIALIIVNNVWRDQISIIDLNCYMIWHFMPKAEFIWAIFVVKISTYLGHLRPHNANKADP